MTAPPSSVRRTLHLAPGHVAFDTRVFPKEARTLAEAGWAVTVVAQHDGDAVVHGVRVVGLPRWRSRWDRFLIGPLRLLRIALAHRSEVVHLHDIEAIPVGFVLALLGRTVILDSHEDYPRLVLDRPWIPVRARRPVARVVGLVERMVARRFAAVVAAEDEGATRFPPDKTVVLHNHVLRREFPGPGPGVRPRDGVVYVGDITAARGAHQMVEIAGRVHERRGCSLELIGRVDPSLAAELRTERGWSAVHALGVQERDGVQAALASAAVALVLLQPTRKFVEGAVPVKLFEYLAAGCVVVASDFPTIRAVAEVTGAVELVDPTDVDAATDAVLRLLDDPVGSAARAARAAAIVRERYSWDAEAPRLLELYARVTASPAA
jgi:glycosyltransferase involved in cell wall biosynthesis